MIERNVCDDAAVVIDHVNSVESPAESDFKQRPLHPAFGKNLQCRERAILKIGQRDVAPRRLDGAKGIDNFCGWRRPGVNPNALFIAQNVRRRIGADGIAARAEQCFQDMHRGALAIGPADRKNAPGPRPAKPVVDLGYTIQPQINLRRRKARHPGKPVVQRLLRIRARHIGPGGCVPRLRSGLAR